MPENIMYSLYIPCKVKFFENLYLLFITQTYKGFIARPDGLESDGKTHINPMDPGGSWSVFAINDIFTWVNALKTCLLR